MSFAHIDTFTLNRCFSHEEEELSIDIHTVCVHELLDIVREKEREREKYIYIEEEKE